MRGSLLRVSAREGPAQGQQVLTPRYRDHRQRRGEVTGRGRRRWTSVGRRSRPARRSRRCSIAWGSPAARGVEVETRPLQSNRSASGGPDQATRAPSKRFRRRRRAQSARGERGACSAREKRDTSADEPRVGKAPHAACAPRSPAPAGDTLRAKRKSQRDREDQRTRASATRGLLVSMMPNASDAAG